MTQELTHFHDMRFVYMIPYEPSHNGIEHLWGKLKFEFRKKLTYYKARRRKFNVKNVYKILVNKHVNPELCKRVAVRGWKNVLHDLRHKRSDITHFQGHEL